MLYLFIRHVGFDPEWLKKYRAAVKAYESTETSVPEFISEVSSPSSIGSVSISPSSITTSVDVPKTSSSFEFSDPDVKDSSESVELARCRWEKMVLLYLVVCLTVLVVSWILKRYKSKQFVIDRFNIPNFC